MFAPLNYTGNVDGELVATGAILPPSAIGTTAGTSAAAQQLGLPSNGTAGTSSCYQQLSNTYTTPSLQFLQQQTLQQMYPQQVYNLIQPAGGQPQLQMGSQIQEGHAQEQGAAQLLGQAEAAFLLDDMTSQSATHLVGPNVAEFGQQQSQQKSQISSKNDKIPKSNGTLSQRCHICGRDFKNKSLLKKHISAAHDRDSLKQTTQTGSGQQRPVSVHARLWCVESAGCDFQSDSCSRLAAHLEDSHGKHLEKVNLHLSSLREFYKWKNNLEETSRVKFILTSGSIVRSQPDSANFIFECHRSATLLAQHRIKQKHFGGRCARNDLDVMEKAVQEILPTGLEPTDSLEDDIYLMEVIEENIENFRDFEETQMKRGRGRSAGPSIMLGVPCCAHIDVQVSLVSGVVIASACISHTGHDSDEKNLRPPDCVLGKLKGMLEAGRCKDELSAGMTQWTKHQMSEGSWKTLEMMSSINADLFPHIRALTRRIFEHASVITRLTNEYYWVDFMETLADLFEVERRLGVIQSAMEVKLEDAGEVHKSRSKELEALETELCYAMHCHGTDRQQLRKVLKYGLDYLSDNRLGDNRYEADIVNVLRTPMYDPSAKLFRRSPGSTVSPDRLQTEAGDRQQKKATSKTGKRNYYRKLIGSEDDSDYDRWSDDEIEDIIPRRWPPPVSPKPPISAQEKRLEKNLKRKQVPVLSVDPILKEKILAMRVNAAHSHEPIVGDNTHEGPTASGSTEGPSASTAKKRNAGKKNVSSVSKIAKGKPSTRKSRSAEASRHTDSNERRMKRESRRRKAINCIGSTSDGDPIDGVEGENGNIDDSSRKCPEITRKKHGTSGHRGRKLRSVSAQVPIKDKHDVNNDDAKTPTPIVIQEIKMDGPAGKKARIVKILATEPGQSVDEATIVVEAPPPTPQSAAVVGDADAAENDRIPEGGTHHRPMVSLLRQGESLLKSGPSVLKQGGTVSLLKRHELLPTLSLPSNGSVEMKNSLTPGSISASREEFFERALHQQAFDEGPLQTPQPPCIADD